MQMRVQSRDDDVFHTFLTGLQEVVYIKIQFTAVNAIKVVRKICNIVYFIY